MVGMPYELIRLRIGHCKNWGGCIRLHCGIGGRVELTYQRRDTTNNNLNIVSYG